MLQGITGKQLKTLDDFLKSSREKRSEKFLKKLSIANHAALVANFHNRCYTKLFCCNYFDYSLDMLIEKFKDSTVLKQGKVSVFITKMAKVLPPIRVAKIPTPIIEIIKKKYIESNAWRLKLPWKNSCHLTKIDFIEGNKVLLSYTREAGKNFVKLYDLKKEKVLDQYDDVTKTSCIEGIGFLVMYEDGYRKFFDCTDPNNICNFNFYELGKNFSGIEPIKDNKRYIAIKIGKGTYKLFDLETKKFVSEKLHDVKKFISLGEDYIAILKESGVIVLNVKNKKRSYFLKNCEKIIWLEGCYTAIKFKDKEKYKIINFDTKEHINQFLHTSNIISLGNKKVQVFHLPSKPISDLKGVDKIIPLKKNRTVIMYKSGDIQLFNSDTKELGCKWSGVKDVVSLGSKMLIIFKGDKDPELFEPDNNEIFKEKLNLEQVLFVTTVINNRHNEKVVGDFIRQHLDIWKSIPPKIRKELSRKDRLGYEVLEKTEELIREAQNIEAGLKFNLVKFFWNKKMAVTVVAATIFLYFFVYMRSKGTITLC